MALCGVEQSKTPAYFGWKCGVPIQSGAPIRSAIQNSGLLWIGVQIALQKFQSAKCPAEIQLILTPHRCARTPRWSRGSQRTRRSSRATDTPNFLGTVHGTIKRRSNTHYRNDFWLLFQSRALLTSRGYWVGLVVRHPAWLTLI